MSFLPTKTFTSLVNGVASTFNAVGTTVSAAAVLGEGLANKAHSYNERSAMDDRNATDLHAKTSAKAHSATLLEELNIINERMQLAKNHGAALLAGEQRLKNFATKVSELTPEQYDDMDRKGINVTDPVALRKYMLGVSVTTDSDHSSSSADSEMSDMDRLLKM